MQTEDLLVIDSFCASHRIEFSFLQSLEEHGLIEFVKREDQYYVYLSELGRLEQMVRLHRDLQINPEGIEAVTHLLSHVEELQRRITGLQNKLSFYERGSED